MKLCVKLVIYKDHTRIHGQQNIKYESLSEARRENSNLTKIWH